MKNLNSTFLILSLLLFFSSNNVLYGQISLRNPDLEAPGCASCPGCTPPQWNVCAGTTPDIQPGEFFVNTLAKSGCTYAGMVMGEYITQQLSCPFIIGKTYNLSVWLAFDSRYGATSLAPGGVGVPGVLEVYGGNVACARTELYWSSGTLPLSSDQNWTLFDIVFTPTVTSTFITFMNVSTGSNVLIDNISQNINSVNPTINIIKGTLSCENDTDGEATVSTGGTYVYDFTWSNGQIDVGVTSSTNNTLGAGNHTVTISDPLDACAGPTIVPIVINAPPPIVLDVVVINESCDDKCDGEAAVSIVSGGLAPFTYQWDDLAGTTTPTITALCDYTFNVEVTDVNGCMFSAVAIIEVESPSHDAGLDNEITVCENNGNVDLFANLLGTPDPLGSWVEITSTGQLSDDQFDVSGLEGQYEFEYTVGEDPCFYNAMVTVIVNKELNPGIGYTHQLCEETNNFDLFSLLTGSPDLDGDWIDDPVNPGGVSGDVFHANAVSPGVFNLKYVVTPEFPCDPNEALVTIEVIEQPDAGLPNTVFVCNSIEYVDLFANLLGTPDNNGYWTDDNATLRLTNGVFNPAGLSAQTYEFTYHVDLIGPCFGATAVIQVIVEEQKEAGDNNSLVFCKENNDVNLFNNLLGSPDLGGNWYYVNGGLSAVTNIFNPNASPEGVYRYVFEEGVSCLADYAEIDIVVNEKPEISSIVDDVCDANNLNYQVTINIFGGDPGSYTVDGLALGSATFVSAWIPTGTSYSFDINDGNACGPITVSGIHACDCATKAGDMNPAILDVCINGQAIAVHDATNVVLDANDNLIYVLHTSSLSMLGDVKAINKLAPEFAFNPGNLTLETTYYISAVAGNALPDGTVDLNDLCLDITPGTPVIFHELPAAELGNGGVICEGDAFDLSIQFNAGSAPYEVIINDGIIDLSFIGLINGDVINVAPIQTTNYDLIQVSDKYGCISEPSITSDISVITVNPIPKANFVGVNTAFCEGFGPAVLTVNIYDGNPNFDITIFDPVLGVESVINNKGLGDIIIPSNNLSAGEYTYVLKSISDVSSAGCTANFIEEVKVTVYENPIVNITGDAAICLGESTELTFTLTQGSYPYTIDYYDPNNQVILNSPYSLYTTLVTPTNIGDNVYEMTKITDTFGCVAIYDAGQQKVTVEVNDLPQVNISHTNVIYCENAKVSNFTFDFISGQGPFEIDYKIFKNGTKILSQTLQDLDATNNTWLFPETTIGVYLVRFEAIRGINCSDVLQEERGIKIMNNPVAELVGDEFICNNENTDVQFKFAGGEWVDSWYFKYQINNEPVVSEHSAFPNFILPLNNVVNTTIVKLLEVRSSVNGCKITYTDKKAVKTVNPEAQVQLLGDNTICYGDVTTLTINVIQGNGPFNLQFNDLSLNGLYNDGDEIIVSPLTTTNIQITEVLDNAFCDGIVINEGANIQVNELPTISFGPDTKICVGDRAKLTISFMNGVGTDYKIVMNGDPLTVRDGDIIEVQPAVSQVYRISQVTDGSELGCTNYQEYFAFVEVIELPQASMDKDFSICANETVQIPIQISGLAPFAISYEDSNNEIYSLTNVGNTAEIPVISNVGLTTYKLKSVQMEEFPFCASNPADLIGESEVQVNPIPVVKFSAADLKGCIPVSPTFVNETDAEYLGTSTWDFGVGTIIEINEMTFTETFHLPRAYEVTLTVESPFGCFGSHTLPEKVVVHPFPNADFRYYPDPIIVGDLVDVRYINRSTGSENYDWLFYKADDINKNVEVFNDENPKQNTPTEVGEYKMELTAISEYGCIDKTEKLIKVIGELRVNIPNAFTPDGDGVNDSFKPIIKDGLAQEYYFAIYDRWGELMYLSNDMTDTSWDGTFNGQPVATGNYIYQVAVKSKYTERMEEFDGSILLMR
jgi:gliding motility-associated-like protein